MGADGTFFTNDIWISTYRDDGLMDAVNIGNYDGVGIGGSSRCIGVSRIFPNCIDGPNNGRYVYVHNLDQNEADTIFQRLPNEASTKNAGKLHNFGTRVNYLNHIVIKKVPPVDGSWSSWVDTTVCSESCGGGTLLQSRTCSDPAPSNGGLECPGSDSQSVSCNTFPCLDCNYPQTNSWYPYWERNGPFEI